MNKNDSARARMCAQQSDAQSPGEVCRQRRDFIAASTAGTIAIATYSSVTEAADNTGIVAAVRYPRLKIASLADLTEGEELAFSYPLNEQPNLLIKLGKEAQGGVGPDKDIVAFSVLCPHMGGSLRGQYQHDHAALGPCPFHFSTFDLSRSGVPVHSSATQNLPQVTLEVADGGIYATGMTGLVYGYRDNLADGTLPEDAKTIGIKVIPDETQRG